MILSYVLSTHLLLDGIILTSIQFIYSTLPGSVRDGPQGKI